MNQRFGFPRPYLSLALFIVWQLLVGELSGASMVMGLILAWILPLLTKNLWPDNPSFSKPWRMPKYLLTVGWDIILASFSVAGLILKLNRTPRPAFVSYPLTLKHPMAISILASTISLTPGTVSADISDDESTLLIHALDVDDDQALIDAIRERYEKPLMEMFP